MNASLNVGANTLTLSTTNGGPLTLAADLFAPGGTVDLVSAGALTQASGIIVSSTLTGSTGVGASLTDGNLFDTLAGFTSTGAANVSITDAQGTGLTLTRPVGASVGTTLTLTTIAGGPLTVAANVTAIGGTVDLISAGALTQTAGVITTATLTGSSVGGASLTGANLFDSLSGFTNTGVGNVSITDARGAGLTVSAARWTPGLATP